MGRKAVVSKIQVECASVKHTLGSTIADLAADLGCSTSALWNAFKRHGIKTRTIQETNSYPINMDCFAKLNDNSAYWIGFAMADGNVGRTGLSVSLSSKDKYHLQKLKQFSEYGGPIYTRAVKHGYKIGAEYCTLRIGSQKMADDLTAWGVTPNKTFTAMAHPDLANNRHFWRGVIDGDGWITKTKLQLGLCGSHGIVSQFADYIEKITGIRRKVAVDKSIFKVWICGNNARLMLKQLYSDCRYYLDRKMSLAKFHINYQLDPTKTPKTQAVIDQIIALRATGMSSNKIGAAIGISKNTVMRYIKLTASKK